MRTDAPIFVADDVIAESAIEFGDGGPEEQDDLVDEFRQFLEDVSPDDFSDTS